MALRCDFMTRTLHRREERELCHGRGLRIPACGRWRLITIPGSANKTKESSGMNNHPQCPECRGTDTRRAHTHLREMPLFWLFQFKDHSESLAWPMLKRYIAA